MSDCERTQALLGQYLAGELEPAEAAGVDRHLTTCPECSDLRHALDLVAATVAPLRDIEPPPHLASDIASSPCRRWLGLLFAAVDRQISEPNLDRLVSHLDRCEPCRRTWNDLTLIHQLGELMAPSSGLVARCVSVARSVVRRPILSRRLAVAAAYVLAVLASLTIGNPVSIARSQVAQRMAGTVTAGVSEAAEEGRGELRVMIFRAWQWGQRQLVAVRDTVLPGMAAHDSQLDQGDQS